MARAMFPALSETMRVGRDSIQAVSLPAKADFKRGLTQDWECKGTLSPPPPALPWLCPAYTHGTHDRTQAPHGLLFSHPAAFPSLSRYSRASAELNRSDGARGAGGVIQQLLHGDANRDHTDRIGVGLVKNCAQSLDSFGCCERAVLGVHRLQRTGKGCR